MKEDTTKRPVLGDTMKIERITIKMVFVETVLGSMPGNPDTLTEYKHNSTVPKELREEEILSITKENKDAVVEDEVEKVMTVFPRDPETKNLCLFNYIFKGALKEWFAAARNLNVKFEGDEVPFNYKGMVHQFILVYPRKVFLFKEDGTHWTDAYGRLERPLRAETMQGPRICLAGSETLPPGTNLAVTFDVLQPKVRTVRKSLAVCTPDWIRWAFEWGSQHGFLQFRSAGYGAFEWEEISNQS